jgi:two-component system chemotaxis response regulator CheY
MSIRLLVADDAPFIREIVRSAVESTAIEVIGEAVDGQEAVEYCLRLQPDVVLMDMVMPIKNGLQATEEILLAHPQQKIIAFSTLTEKEMAVKAINSGCIDFIEKPFEVEQLVRAIQQAHKMQRGK